MFSAIAERYDLLNTLLSFGIDRRWRAQAARSTTEHTPERVLDVATGTGELAIAIKRRAPGARVVGVDFAEAMLEVARRKARRRGLEVCFCKADGMALPFADDAFDAVTIAYGLRNFADRLIGLREFYRVLAPGGRLVILEFPPPPAGVFGILFRCYFLHVLPRVGAWLSGSGGAYSYLPASVLEFPRPLDLAGMLQRAGFARVRYKLQTFGVSALHVADKPKAAAPGAKRQQGVKA